PTRLRQILMNLVSNAIKFTDAGAVTVEVALKAGAEADGGSLNFAVIDTGIGLTAEQQSRLFEAFSQVHTGSNRRYGGTGLGLAISRRLTEMLGGELSVQSRAGEGSTFSMRLPIGSLA